MEIDDDELLRTVTGLLILARSEVRDGTLFQTPEAKQAIGALSAGLNRYDFDVRLSARTSEELAAQVPDLVRDAVSEVGGNILRALLVMAGQFGAFCDQVQQQAPELDIDAILQSMALAAAGGSEQ